MTRGERIKKAIKLLKEVIDCLEESGGYARVGSPVKYNKKEGRWEEIKSDK